MKILLDECVPLPLRKLLPGHDCRSAQEMGWKSVKNGELLALAETEFDLFITSDQGIAYQQNLRGRQIAILQLSTNKLRFDSSRSCADPHGCENNITLRVPPSGNSHQKRRVMFGSAPRNTRIKREIEFPLCLWFDFSGGFAVMIARFVIASVLVLICPRERAA